ncbi:MAG: zinc ribbon domain-containing protein, partial [bacterium]|nr:zinc ribbon domain-containing protein [bacterium]
MQTGYGQNVIGNSPVMPYDHTGEFHPQDISDNKAISMLVYLFGWLGVIICSLIAKDSPYAAFHLRQSIKMT